MAKPKPNSNRAVEKERSRQKERMDAVDDILFSLVDEEQEVAKSVFKAMALEDPKAYAQLMISRLPKVEKIDQDLEKSFLSLSEMLKDLPDQNDLSIEFTKLRKENDKLKATLTERDAQLKDQRDLLARARRKLKNG